MQELSVVREVDQDYLGVVTFEHDRRPVSVRVKHQRRVVDGADRDLFAVQAPAESMSGAIELNTPQSLERREVEDVDGVRVIRRSRDTVHPGTGRRRACRHSPRIVLALDRGVVRTTTAVRASSPTMRVPSRVTFSLLSGTSISRNSAPSGSCQIETVALLSKRLPFLT